MSGLEVLGIIASISQLVQYSVRLIGILQDICQNAAHSAKRYRRHELQVKQVLQIAELIRATEKLQSELIISHLDSLAETTKSIEGAIEKTLYFAGPASKFKKCLRSLEVSKADSAISRGFDDLERDKSCLTLCLLGNFGSLIVNIESSVEKITDSHGRLEMIHKSLQECPKIAEESKKIKEEAAVSSSHRVYYSTCGCEQKHIHKPVLSEVCNSPYLFSEARSQTC
ncbi:hypothetical protein SLS58_001921 [Diplodia intermedia]|uniref:Fungal N-terminal domain-containing protein n=1 Tax=Diplodia intermedia TaxID=856260 RepID=A0ABR3U079_9PEZI